MAIQTVKQLVEDRVIVTKEVLTEKAPSLIEMAIEEVRAIHGFDDKKDSELAVMEKIFIADTAAVKVLQRVLDRYKEDAKAKDGPDGLVHEAQDKLKYLKEQIKQFKDEADFVAGRLGLKATGAVPPIVVKISAATETDE